MANHPDSTRLNKAISDSGYCSRRQADTLIERGRVTVNGETATLGDRAMPDDIVMVDGKKINENENLVYIVLNKPAGITCTTDQRVEGNVVDFIGHKERIFHVGRLDKPSEGLLLMTNDGDIVNKILRAGNRHEKEYIVKVDRPVTSEFIKKMGSGIPILETVTKRCEVVQMSRFVFKIILVQGLNRQIRRMCEFLGHEVVALKRIRIMNIELGELPLGEWRDLTEKELQTLKDDVSESENISEKQKRELVHQETKADETESHEPRIKIRSEKRIEDNLGKGRRRRGPR